MDDPLTGEIVPICLNILLICKHFLKRRVYQVNIIENRAGDESVSNDRRPRKVSPPGKYGGPEISGVSI